MTRRGCEDAVLGEALGKNLFEKNIVAFRHYESFSQAKKLWSFPKPLPKTFTKWVLPTHSRVHNIVRPFVMLCAVKVSLMQYRFYCLGKFIAQTERELLQAFGPHNTCAPQKLVLRGIANLSGTPLACHLPLHRGG